MLPLKDACPLRYTHADDSGYTRVKKGRGFAYVDDKKRFIRDKQTLDRIKSLVIPPAWTNVWITSYSNGHLQATGIDSKGRKQYLYHPLWNELREKNKIENILAFGKALPKLRKHIQRDLKKHKLGKEKVTALALNIMEDTLIRAGSIQYRKQNNSYGLTTLRTKHVQINGQVVFFKFVGKKGKEHQIKLSDRSLAKRLRQVMELPGQEVFQYYNEKGERCKLDSGDLNEYIHQHTKQHFTTKDFRTWYATFFAFSYLIQPQNNSESTIAYKQNLNKCLDFVAKKLGNTRAVCKASYVCGELMDTYQLNGLQPFVKKWKVKSVEALEKSQIEKLLLTFLANLKRP
ncbi:DNA topoisomerase IB [Olivibacter ginsenosidimutans]|uniref:DNA topoisomerase n=1 Tax=Olivibacter ginsenosidimutans TaxID=1176537 RepID=A0ABP9ADA5_9SPHI